MKHQKTLLALAMLASAAVTGTAQASLVDRGNGMLYDDVLNVTWLQDANYAHTSGYALADSGGRMDAGDAYRWAANLVYGGYSDWRLPINTPVSGGSSFNYDANSYNGSTDIGQNITNPHSELAYMYYVNLGLKSSHDTDANLQADGGIFGNGTYYVGQNNVGLVINLKGSWYWSETHLPDAYDPDSVAGYRFAVGSGDQEAWDGSYKMYAWAVRPGDVSAVPVPGAVWLFGSGLLGLLGFKKRKAA